MAVMYKVLFVTLVASCLLVGESGGAVCTTDAGIQTCYTLARGQLALYGAAQLTNTEASFCSNLRSTYDTCLSTYNACSSVSQASTDAKTNAETKLAQSPCSGVPQFLLSLPVLITAVLVSLQKL